MKLRIAVLLLVALCVSGQVPKPESHFGHPIGVDRELLDWDKVVSYFQALAKASDKIRVKELGKTAEGRPFIAATISSAATLRNLDHYQAIQAKLADPRKTSPEEAEKLIGEGKVVVLVTCSIHATEVASTHTAVEFAYRLLTEDKPKFRAILDNVIFILVPSQNPDGVDIVTRWYRKTLGTKYEGTQPPELYHKYVGHDNNRDWYVFSQPETRHTVTLQNAWHPQIVYDVHQQGPFASRLFVPPWMNPVDPNIDAIIAQECNWIGTGVAVDLAAAGKKGVVINALYDFWTPSRHYQAYHAGMRILTESASARLASPLTVRPEQIQATGLGYNPRERSWNYLEPWEGGVWRLRDIIDYQLLAFESILYQAATRRSDLLRNFYQVGRRAVARTSPYAFVIPKAQLDPGSSRKMLELLHFGAVDIERADTAFDAGGKRYPAGSYFVGMQQPYSSYAKTLLERQHYPDLRLYPGGPPQRPYDVTAQTLPLLLGVATETVEKPFAAAAHPATTFEFELSGTRPADGSLAASDIDSWRAANKIWATGASVWRDPSSGTFFPQKPSSGNAVEIKPPHIGLYKSYMPAMDEGWTRWLFENFGFAYKNVLNPEIAGGGLRQKYDVLVFPDQPEVQLSHGFEPGSMPDEYTGGLDAKAAANLKKFADEGGTLVFLNHSSEFALDALGVNAKNVVRGVSNQNFYSPGSLLNVSLDTHDRLAYGLPEEIAIWSEGSPAWELPAGSRDRIVARYPKDHVLASGWLLGEKYLENRAALLVVPSGDGQMVLFGMRPQFRAQSYQAFKLFFNSLLLSSGRR
ncbi:MAG TPA: M14 metallopeptidase family protein [Bryobacteraceae bacterium]|nr:M14 metallopeptidase family protein [Bryobacteraceae bacterium]